MANPEELTRQCVELLERARALKDSAGLNAVARTQTTDVETECDGPVTCDRDIPKPDLKKVAGAGRGVSAPSPRATAMNEGIHQEQRRT